MMSMTELVAVKGTLRWRPAKIVEVIAETPRTKTLVVRVSGWEGHRPGQYVNVRFTAEDGYQVQRSYSIASSPEKEQLTLLISGLNGSELSQYPIKDPWQGDELELRGPIGVNFSWGPQMGGPLLLVAGGCGIAPLMSIIRHRVAVGYNVQTRLLYSSRSLDNIAYREELSRFAKTEKSLEVIHTLTRSQPSSWMGYRRRIDMEMLKEVAWCPKERPLIFICGPTPLVQRVAMGLVELGHDPACIKRPRASYRR
jgi:ferredoxin-NADP reductase